MTLAGIAGAIFVAGLALLPAPRRYVPCGGSVAAPLIACSQPTLAAVARIDSSQVVSDILQRDSDPNSVTSLPASTVRPVQARCGFQSWDSGDYGQANYSCVVNIFDANRHKQRTFNDTVGCLANSSNTAVDLSNCTGGATQSSEIEQPVPAGATTTTSSPASTPTAATPQQRATILHERLGHAGYFVTPVEQLHGVAAPGFTALSRAQTILVMVFQSPQAATQYEAGVAAHPGHEPYKMVGADLYGGASQKVVAQVAAAAEGQ